MTFTLHYITYAWPNLFLISFHIYFKTNFSFSISRKNGQFHSWRDQFRPHGGCSCERSLPSVWDVSVYSIGEWSLPRQLLSWNSSVTISHHPASSDWKFCKYGGGGSVRISKWALSRIDAMIIRCLLQSILCGKREANATHEQKCFFFWDTSRYVATVRFSPLSEIVLAPSERGSSLWAIIGRAFTFFKARTSPVQGRLYNRYGFTVHGMYVVRSLSVHPWRAHDSLFARCGFTACPPIVLSWFLVWTVDGHFDDRSSIWLAVLPMRVQCSRSAQQRRSHGLPMVQLLSAHCPSTVWFEFILSTQPTRRK